MPSRSDLFTVEHLQSAPSDRVESLIRGALQVKNAGWRDTYSDWLSADYLDTMDARLEEQVQAWGTALDGGRLLPTWVAVAVDVPDASQAVGPGPGQVIGVASAHSTSTTHDRGAFAGGTDGVDVELELSVLYVDAAWRGSGVATRLADTAIGDASACLWVLEDNPRACAFYAKLGFVPDGAVEDLPAEWNGAREIRMLRR